MRNRFKPTLSTSRAGRRSGSSTLSNANAGENVSSGSAANTTLQETAPKANEEGKSSETVPKTSATTEQDKIAQLKTPSTSSTSTAGLSRRSRIKPAVIPVARTPRNSRDKDKTTTESRNASADEKDSNSSVSQGHKTSHNKDNHMLSHEEQGQEEGKSSETVPKTSATTEQEQDKTAELKTPSTSSASTAGLSRRSRIKPAVIPVARTPRNSRNKDKTTTESRNASADEKDSNSSVSQGHKTSHNKDNHMLSHEEQGQEEGKSSETVPKTSATTEQEQDKTAELKTPSTSSASTAGLSRRSRIKPAVIPVARTPRNSRNKDKTTTESRNASADEKDSNSSVSQGHKTSHNKDNHVLSHEEQGQEEGKSSETVPKTSATTEQEQDKTAELKTPSTSSASTAGLSRRSHIKPAVIPVACTPRNSRNKDKTTTESRNASADEKDSNSSVSQGHKTSRNKDNHVLSHEEQGQEVDSSTEDVSKLPSLKERNQQMKSRCSAVTSPSVTNTEQRSQPVVTQDPVIKPSQSQNKNTSYDNTVIQTNESGAPPSLPRRKRVLPNLGSTSRKRHYSVSKENVEKNTEVPEVIHEEVVTTGKDLGHINEQSPVECRASRNKRLRSCSEEQNTADHGQPPVAASDIHDKEHTEEEEEGPKRKGVKRKRGGRPRKLKEPSDPSQMTMQHLIYFNPKTNPMTSSLAGKKKKPERKSKRKKGKDKNLQEITESIEETNDVNNPSSVSESPAKTNPTENSKDTSVDDGDADNSDAVAPRVKLDADGNIIVDEESLLIPKSPEKALDDSEIVYEDADEVNSGAYLKHRKVERWSLKETQKFYKALSQVGTDFSMMCPLFPSRIRRELKSKFKREEKLHRSLVEKALCVRNPIEVELFTPKVDGEEIDDDLTSTENSSSTQLALNTEEQ